MADTQRSSPLQRANGAAGPEATEAFALLANETRLAILLALWERHDPGGDDRPASFSELYDRIDYDNAGNFSYHLDELQGQFVRKRAGGGYELRTAGLEVVRTVIAGARVEDATLEPTEIDRDCHLCGAPTAVSYGDGTLSHVCTACPGVASRDGLPDGYLKGMKFHPAGLTGRSADELLAAAEVAAYRHMRTMFEGLCSACSGAVDATLAVCADHDGDGTCANCGRVPAYTAQFECRVCKDFHGTTPAVLCVFHPATVAFYYDHGVVPRWHAEEFDGLTRVGEDEPEHETTLVSERPPRVAVTIALGGDELQLTFDETVSVVDVDW